MREKTRKITQSRSVRCSGCVSVFRHVSQESEECDSPRYRPQSCPPIYARCGVNHTHDEHKKLSLPPQ